MERLDFLKNKAAQIRRDVITMIYEAGTGHTGGAMSCTDIMTVLFYEVMNIDPKRPEKEDRDKFILSKGHCVEPYLNILGDLDFFPKENLKTFSRFGSKFIGHPNNKIPGIEVNTGALGHGLPMGVGMALAAKRKKINSRVFVLMGDGEQAEGSVWEAAMSAGHYKLDNLVGIIDRNRLQISGSTEQVMALEPLEDKWAAFGWKVINVEGNSIEDLVKIFSKIKEIKRQPILVMANTTKGSGISYMENIAKWHHGVPTQEQYKQAMKELGGEM